MGRDRRSAYFACALVFVSALAWAQTVAVDLPPRVKEIIRLMYERHRDLAHGDDDARRTLTRMIAEQIAYEFGPRWGTKAQSPSHPPSKDAIAFQTPDGQLFAWDWQNGATREPFDEPIRHTITGQHFIAVTPKNHLGAPPPFLIKGRLSPPLTAAKQPVQ